MFLLNMQGSNPGVALSLLGVWTYIEGDGASGFGHYEEKILNIHRRCIEGRC
jgi:hypothetical protein